MIIVNKAMPIAKTRTVKKMLPLLKRRDRRRPQPGVEDRQREQRAEAQEDVGLPLGFDETLPAERRVIVDEGADQSRRGNDERGKEQAVAEPVRPGGAFGLARRRGRASPDQAEAGKSREAEHEQAVDEVGEPGASDQAQRHQAPEGGIANALSIGAIGHAQDREQREHRAGERVGPLHRDHRPRLLRDRSNSSNRAP